MLKRFNANAYRTLFTLTLATSLLALAASVAVAQQTTTTNQNFNTAATNQNTNAQVATTTTVTTTTTTPPAAPLMPVYTDYRGARIGMSAAEVREKLGHLKNKNKNSDSFVFSDAESAEVYYNKDGKARVISITYFGDKTNAPEPSIVVGKEITPKPNGSMYELVRYPQAGYWVAYSRTKGKTPLVIVTMQKLRAQK